MGDDGPGILSLVNTHTHTYINTHVHLTPYRVSGDALASSAQRKRNDFYVAFARPRVCHWRACVRVGANFIYSYDQYSGNIVDILDELELALPKS